MEKPLKNRYLLMTVGIPASGKSTAVRYLKEQLRNKGLNDNEIIIIDTDRIRFDLFGNKFNPENESNVLAKKYSIIESYATKPEVKLIISDDLNYLLTQRRKLRDIAIKHGLIPLIIYYECDISNAISRNENRNKKSKGAFSEPLNSDVIMKISENMDVPGQKYMWDRPNLIIDTNSNNSLNNANEMVNVLFSLDKSSKDLGRKESKGTTKERSVEQLKMQKMDKITREIIGLISNGDLTQINEVFHPYSQIILNIIKNRIDPLRLSKIRREFIKSFRNQKQNIMELSDGSIIETFLKYLIKKK